MSELTITAIHVVAIRNAVMVTGKLHSGQLAKGDELRRNDGSVIPILGIEFPMPNTAVDSVTVVVPIESATTLQIGEILHSGGGAKVR